MLLYFKIYIFRNCKNLKALGLTDVSFPMLRISAALYWMADAGTRLMRELVDGFL